VLARSASVTSFVDRLLSRVCGTPRSIPGLGKHRLRNHFPPSRNVPGKRSHPEGFEPCCRARASVLAAPPLGLTNRCETSSGTDSWMARTSIRWLTGRHSVRLMPFEAIHDRPARSENAMGSHLNY